MRLGGLFLLLLLSYFFNPIQPIVEEPIIDLSEIETIDPLQIEELDASLLSETPLPVAV